MLAVSRLYSFLDHKEGFNVHFLEGQKLIHDLVLLHPMKGSGFAYFRDTFLGLMPIIFFLRENPFPLSHRHADDSVP